MSLGYVPPVSRLKLPARRGSPWVTAPWNYRSEGEGQTPRGARRGLILDLDDTLYPRKRFLLSGFAAVGHHVESAHGIPAELVYRVLARAQAEQPGQEFQYLCARAGLSGELVPSFLDVFRRHMPSIWLNHGVAGALQALRAAGWRLGILTNGLPSVQFRKVAALGLTSLVDEVVYAEEHAAGGKPAGPAFKAVLRSLELSAGQCVCVGDDPVRDVRGARALGMRTIRVARPRVAVAPGAEADVVIDSFRDLPAAAALLIEAVTADVA